jgi:hypothetical protein
VTRALKKRKEPILSHILRQKHHFFKIFSDSVSEETEGAYFGAFSIVNGAVGGFIGGVKNALINKQKYIFQITFSLKKFKNKRERRRHK